MNLLNYKQTFITLMKKHFLIRFFKVHFQNQKINNYKMEKLNEQFFISFAIF